MARNPPLCGPDSSRSEHMGARGRSSNDRAPQRLASNREERRSLRSKDREHRPAVPAVSRSLRRRRGAIAPPFESRPLHLGLGERSEHLVRWGEAVMTKLRSAPFRGARSEGPREARDAESTGYTGDSAVITSKGGSVSSLLRASPSPSRPRRTRVSVGCDGGKQL